MTPSTRTGTVMTAFLFVGILASTGWSMAEDLPREAILPLASANKAAAAALEKCKQDGYKVSVAVVDRAGLVRTLMRVGT